MRGTCSSSSGRAYGRDASARRRPRPHRLDGALQPGPLGDPAPEPLGDPPPRLGLGGVGRPAQLRRSRASVDASPSRTPARRRRATSLPEVGGVRWSPSSTPAATRISGSTVAWSGPTWICTASRSATPGRPATPRSTATWSGPLDGSVDRIAGHGTFIAGLVHQVCPDATILAWRGIETTKALVESEWLTTLAQITELVRLDREGKPGGHPIDVLSLSLGYYHENDVRRPARPDPVDHPRRARTARRRGGVLGRERRDGAPVLPRGVRSVEQQQGPVPDPPQPRPGRVGWRPEPQRDRRPLLQHRSVGARLRARRGADEHHAAVQRWSPGGGQADRPRARAGVRRPRRLPMPARTRTGAGSAGSGCGAARPSRRR